MLEQELKVKQNYLRQEILQKGYQPEEFIGFLNTTLKVDSDLNQCSISELKDVVKNFKDSKQSTIVQKIDKLQQSIAIKKDLKHSTIIYVSLELLKKSFDPPIVQEEFQSTFKCLKIIPKFTPEVVKKMVCEVTNPQRKYVGGVFGIGATSFLEFQVTTSEVDWSVGRRYSDFVWFRTILKKFFPSIILPPIPEKKAAKRLPRQIQKRMRILAHFLNDLIKIPEILNSKYFQNFLTIKDLSKFQKFKTETDKKVIFENIGSTQTQTGLVTVTLNNPNLVYFKNLKNFVSKSEVLYKQVTRASKRFQAQRIDEVNQLYDIGNKFAQLYQVGKDFYNQTKNENINSLNEIFIKLNNMMIEWGNNIKTEIELLQINFNTFFKYQRESYAGYHQAFLKVDELEQKFLKMKKQLDDKKEKIFLQHDPNKWSIQKKDIPYIPKASIHDRNQAFKIMLPKQSVQLQTVKMDYAFYLSRYCDSSDRYFQRQMVKFNNNFNEVAIKNKVSNQQLGESWNQMCYTFSHSSKVAKKLMQIQKLQQIKDLSQSKIIQE